MRKHYFHLLLALLLSSLTWTQVPPTNMSEKAALTKDAARVGIDNSARLQRRTGLPAAVVSGSEAHIQHMGVERSEASMLRNGNEGTRNEWLLLIGAAILLFILYLNQEFLLFANLRLAIRSNSWRADHRRHAALK